MNRKKLCILIAISVVTLTLEACREVPTSAKLYAGPTFSLGGSGRLASFRIYGPQPGHKIATPFDAKSLVWRLEPAEGYFKGSRVEELKIVYGNTPSGYKQTIPAGSVSKLPPGQIYYFLAETTNAPPAEGFFYLDGVVPISVKVPGLCQSGFEGEVKAIKCGSNEPYAEPSDLAQFVRDNQIHN